MLPASHSNNDRFFTTGQVAQYCGVHFRTVIRWIQRGELRAYRLPGRGDHRVSIGDLVAFLEKNRMRVPDELLVGSGSTKKVALIVEDEPSMARSIVRLLHQQKFETLIAKDGFQAGIHLGNASPMLMTLDLKMPGMNGFDVLKVVRAREELGAMKILVISGDAQENLKKALREGADAVLPKPFTRTQFLEKLVKILPQISESKMGPRS